VTGLSTLFDGIKTISLNPLEVLVESITRSRAKKLKATFNEHI